MVVPSLLLQFQPCCLRIQASVIRFHRDSPVLHQRYPTLNPSTKSLSGYRAGAPHLLMDGQQLGTLVALH
jgi:hypothetical protein